MASPKPEREAALAQFLKRYFADEDGGRPAALDEYLAAFPDHQATVAGAYRQLQQDPPMTRDDRSLARGRIGRFQILRTLGRGGQGTVVLAEDTRLPRRVAVKLLAGLAGTWDDTALVRFRREAELASRLRHPGICPVFEMDVEDGVPFLVMPFVVGRSLAEILADGPVEIARALRWGEAIARALDAAHQAGVVHRDIKPANIMIDEEDRPIIMDFGVARAVDEVGTVTGASLTGAGALIGTLPFMAPEQVQGGEVDMRTDIYALGVALYECCARRLPFEGSTQREVMNAIVADPPPPLRRANPAASPDLQTVLETALQKAAADRFHSAAALADELRRVAERRPILSRPAGPWLRLRRWVERETALAASVGGAVFLLVAGLVLSLWLLTSVDAERRRTDQALIRVQRLADVTRLQELVAELEALEPLRPADGGALRDWLTRADALLARLPAHRVMLDELRARALPRTEADRRADRVAHPRAAEFERKTALAAYLRHGIQLVAGLYNRHARTDRRRLQRDLAAVESELAELEPLLAQHRTWRFADAEDRWRHGLQAGIVEQLEAFGGGDLLAPTRARGAQLLAELVAQRRASLVDAGDAWRQCIEQVRADPRTAGLRLVPQFGLVPLGPDRASGLQEFAHLPTGAAARRDAETGELVFDADHGMVLVLLPACRARLGAQRPTPQDPIGGPRVDLHAQPYEEPVVEADLAAFFCAKFEMTQAQWLRAVGQNPSQARPGVRYRGHPEVTLLHPVESVNWYEADAALRRLGLALPTSAQWEYAARGGTDTVFFTGDDPESLAGAANVADMAFVRASGQQASANHELFDDRWASHAPVGVFVANDFGLHDVIGNVYEWCRDGAYRHREPFRPGDGLNLVADLTNRTIRGGSASQTWSVCRSAARTELRPELRRYDLGVRPVRPLDPAPDADR
ncbi:MAG: SUMF1/EgtB/PvdO family nonheme iron enzyme [Planctomycetota bacterium]